MKTTSLIHVCNAIAFLTLLLGTIHFLDIFTLCYDLGKDDTDTLIWQVLAQGIEAWGIIFCCILFFTLVSRAKKGKIFVAENEILLMIFGIVTVCIGVISKILIHIFAIKVLSTSIFDLLILEGFSFIFFSLIFKIGRKMKEEQEFTI